MHATLSPYWVTVELERGRTVDRRLMARSRWAAWWLGCRLWGHHHVVMVRKVR